MTRLLELKATLAGINNIDFSGDQMQQGEQQPLIPNELEEGEFENYEQNLKDLGIYYDGIAQRQQMMTGLATGFGQALTGSFAAAISGSGNFFQMMGDYLKQLAIQLAATAAAALLLNVLLGGAGLAIGGFGSFKESFGTLFGGGGGFGGFGGGGGIIGGIRGRDTVLSYDRSQQFNTRTTGIR